jgi:hypothetical protein
MKNKCKLLGIAVVIAAIVFGAALLFTGCDDVSKNDNSGGSNDGGGNDNSGGGKSFTERVAFIDWYDKQPDNTPDNPYRVKLNFKDVSFDFTSFNLGLMYFGRQQKYVFLDCSGSPFTSIGNEAFKGRGNLVGMIIPDSVTTIGTNAFSGCTNLTGVTLPNNITIIRSNTFDGCTKLSGIIIPDNVTSIGNNAFNNCVSLTSVTIPNKVTSIGNNAFAKTRLTSINIPNGVTYLSGFNGCVGLTGITIPNSVTKIGGGAFNGCTGLTSVTIPSSVTNIEAGAFGKTDLTSVTFEGTIPNSDFIDMNIFVDSESFPGDLRKKFYATDSKNGTPGTYTRVNASSSTWTKQP